MRNFWLVAIPLIVLAAGPAAADKPEISIPENQNNNDPHIDPNRPPNCSPPTSCREIPGYTLHCLMTSCFYSPDKPPSPDPTPQPTPQPQPFPPVPVNPPHHTIFPFIGYPIVQPGMDEDAARRALEQYLKDHPGDGADALDRYLAANPNDPWALVLRGQIDMNRENYTGARDLALKALAVDSADQKARDLKGMAEDYLRGGIKMARPPAKPDFIKKETTGLTDGGNSAAGAGAAGFAADPGQWQRPDLISGRPRSTASASDKLVGQAYSKARANDLSGSLMDLTRAIDADPKNQNAWALRATLDNRAKNYAAGKHDADEALKLDPDNPAALRARAFAQYNMGNFSVALADAEKAIALDGANGLGHLYRAMILEKLGRLSDALREYQTAFQCDPALKGFFDEAQKRLAPGSTQDAGRASRGLANRLFLSLAAVAVVVLLFLGVVGSRGSKRAMTREVTVEPTPPAPMMPGSVLGPGTVLGENYVIKGVLGRGGMGTVYAAEDRVLQRPVAIKQLTVLDRSPEFIERFLREARLVAKLKHANLVQIYAVTEYGGEQYLIFEFVEGRTLNEILSERGRLAPKAARNILSDLCAGLAFAHAERIIHRDLKPANVMVGPDGACKIMDFGIAHQARSASTMTQTAAWGTPPYMAPEQEMGTVGPESDLYALAIMTYEMLAGRRPFEGETSVADKVKGTFAPASTLNPELPKGLDAFLTRALSPAPESRPRSAKQFLAELDSALTGFPVA